MDKKNSFEQIQSYEGCELYAPEAQFLKTIEFLLGLKIPELNPETFKEHGFGFVAKNKHIIYFGLRNKSLLLIPSSINNLQKLETLDLRGNNIKVLPDTTKDLQNLKDIKVDEDMIQKIDHKPESPHPVLNEDHLNLNEANYAKNNQQKLNNQSNKCKVKILFDSKISNINKTLGELNKNSENRYKIKTILKDKLGDTLESAKEAQKSHLICKKCNIEKNKLQKIDLVIVRKSPRKLVFIINNIFIECLNCHETKKITNPSHFILNRVPKFNNVLTNEIISQLKQNKYCKICNNYYTNLDKCPIHKNSIDYPKLVFIRGINKQFYSDLLLRQKN